MTILIGPSPGDSIPSWRASDGEVVNAPGKIDGMYGPGDRTDRPTGSRKLRLWPKTTAQKAWIDALITVLSQRRSRRFRRLQHRLGRGYRFARRLGERLHRGLRRSAWDFAARGSHWSPFAISKPPIASRPSAPMRSGLKTTHRSWTNTRKLRRGRHIREGYHGGDARRRTEPLRRHRHQPAQPELDPQPSTAPNRSPSATSWPGTSWPLAAGGLSDEFAFTDEEKARNRSTVAPSARCSTSTCTRLSATHPGRINPGVGTPKETLKSYASALEETRAPTWSPCTTSWTQSWSNLG